MRKGDGKGMNLVCLGRVCGHWGLDRWSWRYGGMLSHRMLHDSCIFHSSCHSPRGSDNRFWGDVFYVSVPSSPLGLPPPKHSSLKSPWTHKLHTSDPPRPPKDTTQLFTPSPCPSRPNSPEPLNPSPPPSPPTNPARGNSAKFSKTHPVCVEGFRV